MSRRGYRTMLRIESFARCQGCVLCIVLVPGLRLQTDPYMPYLSMTSAAAGCHHGK